MSKGLNRNYFCVNWTRDTTYKYTWHINNTNGSEMKVLWRCDQNLEARDCRGFCSHLFLTHTSNNEEDLVERLVENIQEYCSVVISWTTSWCGKYLVAILLQVHISNHTIECYPFTKDQMIVSFVWLRKWVLNVQCVDHKAFSRTVMHSYMWQGVFLPTFDLNADDARKANIRYKVLTLSQPEAH